MGFRLRQADNSYYTSATWISADGTTQSFPDGAFDAQPLNKQQTPGAQVPTQWRLTLPERDLDITAEAINPNAWMPLSVPYWEGPILIDGSHKGRGYLEMTGYE
jgi:predicted secreted hydrolase